jgi:hypothetical protein
MTGSVLNVGMTITFFSAKMLENFQISDITATLYSYIFVIIQALLGSDL